MLLARDSLRPPGLCLCHTVLVLLDAGPAQMHIWSYLMVCFFKFQLLAMLLVSRDQMSSIAAHSEPPVAMLTRVKAFPLYDMQGGGGERKIIFQKEDILTFMRIAFKEYAGILHSYIKIIIKTVFIINRSK